MVEFILLFLILGFFLIIVFVSFDDLFVLQTGKLSTGDSLDMSPHDEASITANDATVKDMEVSYIPKF